LGACTDRNDRGHQPLIERGHPVATGIPDSPGPLLLEAICHDLESSDFCFDAGANEDVSDQRLNEMTDRELLGAILESSIDMLVSKKFVTFDETKS
jgi:hypothetical protein